MGLSSALLEGTLGRTHKYWMKKLVTCPYSARTISRVANLAAVENLRVHLVERITFMIGLYKKGKTVSTGKRRGAQLNLKEAECP